MILLLTLILLGPLLAKVEIIYDKTRGAVIKNDSCHTYTVTVNAQDFEVPANSEKAVGSHHWSAWHWFPGTKGSILPREVPSPLKNKVKYDHGPGEGIHSGNQINGYDFSVPEGTPVFAVAEGVVVKVVDHYSEAHQDMNRRNEVNEVEILHADGTVARYVHLQAKGALVKVCDKVKAGQEIAKSGNTGFSKGPHLHFEIYRPTGVSQSMTISLYFREHLPSK